VLVAGVWLALLIPVSIAQEVAQTPAPIAKNEFPNALIPDLIADPSIVFIDGTFYCYATTDGYNTSPLGFGPGVVWTSRDFVNWSFHGLLLPNDHKDKYVAPSTPVHRGDTYYLYPTVNHQITPMMMKNLEGPLLDPNGHPVNDKSDLAPMPITIAKSIDAEVFTDDDGRAYMVWAQRGIARVAADMVSFDGPQTTVPTKRQGYSEGPFLFKRAGIYYYLYTLGAYENYQYAYMMSRVSPLGPWESPNKDILTTTDPAHHIYGPGHGCVFRDPATGQWYFVYLEYGRGGSNRQVLVDRMDFEADGTIRPITLTGQGVGALRPLPPEHDLSLGAHATASSTKADYIVPRKLDPSFARTESFAPEYAIDHSNGTRWMADETDAAPWFEIDLGVVHRITRTEAYFVTPTAGHLYRIESSKDGVHWKIYQPAAPLAIESPHVCTKKVSARFLRLYILKGAPGLWEFHVFD
jgi:hypothetical protein